MANLGLPEKRTGPSPIVNTREEARREIAEYLYFGRDPLALTYLSQIPFLRCPGPVPQTALRDR
jgi:hypothetical protein